MVTQLSDHSHCIEICSSLVYIQSSFYTTFKNDCFKDTKKEKEKTWRTQLKIKKIFFTNKKGGGNVRSGNLVFKDRERERGNRIAKSERNDNENIVLKLNSHPAQPPITHFPHITSPHPLPSHHAQKGTRFRKAKDWEKLVFKK